MSRPIKMTQAYMDECRQDFEKALQLTKLADGKLTFTKTFSIADRKAVLYFTANAWAKMTALIRDFDKEVAWHGVASRGEDESIILLHLHISQIGVQLMQSDGTSRTKVSGLQSWICTTSLEAQRLTS